MAVVPVSIGLGKKELLASGSVVLGSGEWLKIDIADLALELHFLSSDSKSGPSVDGDTDDKRSIIRLYNFNNPLGSSWFNDVGFVNGRQLNLAVFVHAIENEGKVAARSISYTLSLGDRVDGQ